MPRESDAPLVDSDGEAEEDGDEIGLEVFTPTVGDINCVTNLFMNNASTIIAVGASLTIAFKLPFKDMPEDLQPTNIVDIVYYKILPGMVPTILFGSIYYAFMSLRAMRRNGTSSMCSLPYGLNTPAALTFIFGIMKPALERAVKESEAQGIMPNQAAANAAVEHAWKVGVVANMLAGLMAMALAPFGSVLTSVTPPAALNIALAGIGFTWLGLQQAVQCFDFAAVGFVCLVLGLGTSWGSIKTGPVPPTLAVVLVGSVLGWLSQVPWSGGGTAEHVAEAWSNVGIRWPTLAGTEILPIFSDVLKSDLGTIVPVAFTGAVGTVLNVNIAKNQGGDEYPLFEALLVDGATSFMAALFGSPIGTCVFIGHPQFKQMGGKLAYPVIFGLLFTVFGVLGLWNFITALVPIYAIAPVLLFIGIAIVSESVSHTSIPKEHLPACMLGLFPAVAEWVIKNTGKPFDTDNNAVFWGLTSLSRGSLMLCVLWTCLFVYVIDSQWAQACIWALAAALMAAIGLVHQDSLDLAPPFAHFAESRMPYPQNHVGTLPASFTFGYASLAALFGSLAVLQKLTNCGGGDQRSWEKQRGDADVWLEVKSNGAVEDVQWSDSDDDA